MQIGVACKYAQVRNIASYLNITFSRFIEYVMGFITKYRNLWPNSTKIIVKTFSPLNMFRSLFLLYLIRSLPLRIIENKLNVSGILPVSIKRNEKQNTTIILFINMV